MPDHEFDFSDEPRRAAGRRYRGGSYGGGTDRPRGPFALGFLVALGVLTALLLFSCLFGGVGVVVR